VHWRLALELEVVLNADVHHDLENDGEALLHGT